MSAESKEISDLVKQKYQHGFVTEIEQELVPPGLDEDVVRLISRKKGEPAFMTDWRLKAFRHWLTMTEPTWAHVRYTPIDYQSISYFAAPKNQADAPKSLDEVDPKLLETYDKLGEGMDKGTHLVGVALEGVLPSYYANAPLPKGVTEDQLYQGEKKSARLFVVGSGDFYDLVPSIGFDDRLAGIGQQLLFSSFEWLAQDNALSKVRDKRLPRYIGEIDRETQKSIQFINILFVPSCFALIGRCEKA